MTESKKDPTAAEWRLVPMVNLASLAVPVSVMMAWLALSASPPAAPVPDVDPADPLDLAVLITPDGFQIQGDDGLLADAGLDGALPCAVLPCASPDAYPLDALHERLRVIKDARPAQQDLTLVPHPNTRYRLIMQTRGMATTTHNEGVAAELFPWVSISPEP